MTSTKRTKEQVDRLLGRVLSNRADVKDMEEFARWIRDYGNERYFEEFRRMWHVAQDRMIGAIDTDAPLDKYMNYIRVRKRRRITFRVAAAVVAITVMAGIFLERHRTAETEGSTPSDLTALLSSRKPVRLELEDGSIVDADGISSGTVMPDSGITSDAAGQLSYTDASRNDLQYFNSITTPAGRRYTAVLADGSKVWLGADSYIRFPVGFGIGERRVILSGRAYFDVAKSSVPFIVATPDMEIEALGTSFDVESYRKTDTPSVILVEGSVRVNALGQDRVISPGEQLQIDKSRNVISVEEVDAHSMTLWKEGILVVRECTFDRMVDKIARWYGVEIENRASVPDGERFNGRFDREDIEQAVRTISLSAKVTYRVCDGKLIIEDR